MCYFYCCCFSLWSAIRSSLQNMHHQTYTTKHAQYRHSLPSLRSHTAGLSYLWACPLREQGTGGFTHSSRKPALQVVAVVARQWQAQNRLIALQGMQRCAIEELNVHKWTALAAVATAAAAVAVGMIITAPVRFHNCVWGRLLECIVFIVYITIIYKLC